MIYTHINSVTVQKTIIQRFRADLLSALSFEITAYLKSQIFRQFLFSDTTWYYIHYIRFFLTFQDVFVNYLYFGRFFALLIIDKTCLIMYIYYKSEDQNVFLMNQIIVAICHML